MHSFARIILVCIGLGISIQAQSQQSLLTLDESYYHVVDRYAILNTQSSTLCTSIKPFNRKYIPEIIEGNALSTWFSERNAFNLDLLKKDNWDLFPDSTTQQFRTKRDKWQNFYQYTGSLFSVNKPDFKLVVNPVLAFAAGKSNGDNVYRNTRGLELRGSIANNVGFYSFISENQFVYPDYYNHQIDQLQVIPGTGFIKTFGNNGYDFFNAQGYITFQANKYIDIQFGHDKNFIGNGYRSLILSDVAKEHLFLKVHTQIWRFNYMNLFSELTDFRFDGVKQQRKKYAAFHYLNFNVIPKKLDIGIFENIVFARNDSNQQAGYEIGYLNPIIFYRAAEHSLNSTDNSLIGADLKWNFARGFSFYSQLVLDEFHKNELVNRTGSWVNKWAFQAGLKYLNVAGINNLDLQVETNMVRPYVYTHLKTDQSWSHFSQPLAHPMGANFKEVLAIARYQVTPRLNLVAKYFNILHGGDSTLTAATSHFGGNIFADYTNRPKEDGIKIGDGVQQNIQLFDFTLSYQIYQRTFFDFRIIYRDAASQNPIKSFSNTTILFGARMNIAGQRFDN
ncbi:MAG: hypothetical protein ACI8SE_000327 [Bacteroidia bacterium]|jgi:hypothetical protein